MNGEYLLDPNIVIALFAGEPGVQASISGAEEIFLSSIVLGELYFGAANSSRPQANTEALEVFAKNCTEVPVDSHTARVYAAIRLNLKKTRTADPGKRHLARRMRASTRHGTRDPGPPLRIR